MSRLLKYKPEYSKEELQSIEKAFKLFADRNGIVNLNNMVIAMKELKLDETEPVIYDLFAEMETEIKTGITYDEFALSVCGFRASAVSEVKNKHPAHFHFLRMRQGVFLFYNTTTLPLFYAEETARMYRPAKLMYKYRCNNQPT